MQTCLYFYSFLYRFCFFASLLLIFGCQRQSLNNSEQEPVIIPEEKKQEIVTKIYNKQQSLGLCNGERDQALSQDSLKIYLLNENQYLVEILCFLGAYQGNYQYLLYNPMDSTMEKISFPIFQDNPQNLQLTNTFTLNGMPEFDEMEKTLSLQAKSRGLGDCGSFAVYQWEGEKFTLKEYRHKSDCDGVYLPPEEYPLIYP